REAHGRGDDLPQSRVRQVARRARDSRAAPRLPRGRRVLKDAARSRHARALPRPAPGAAGRSRAQGQALSRARPRGRRLRHPRAGDPAPARASRAHGAAGGGARRAGGDRAAVGEGPRAARLMPLHPLAGQPAPPELLVDVPRLVSAYYTLRPDPADPAQRVAFGTSGHRGSALRHAFNEAHVLAIAQAIVELRRVRGVTGPLFLGTDTHALAEPARASALEVFAAHGVEVVVQDGLGPTPTPVVSHAILAHNRGRTRGLADGVVITPSHNPPEADLAGVRRIPYERALAAATTHRHDYVRPYVEDLRHVVDVAQIARAGLRLGVDPLGGASLAYWDAIAATYGIALTVVSREVDPTFRFMPVDHDGKIRTDCSSPWAMARLVALRDRFDIAFGNDADADRHGVVTPAAGLMN